MNVEKRYAYRIAPTARDCERLWTIYWRLLNADFERRGSCQIKKQRREAEPRRKESGLDGRK